MTIPACSLASDNGGGPSISPQSMNYPDGPPQKGQPLKNTISKECY